MKDPVPLADGDFEIDLESIRSISSALPADHPREATVRPAAPRLHSANTDLRAGAEPAPAEAPGAAELPDWLPPLSLADGDEVAELQVLGDLGRGGMGAVRVARQRSLDRNVAIKTVRADKATSGNINALLREAHLAGSLDHPNHVPIHWLGKSEPEGPVLVMKQVVGTPWKELIHDDDHPGWGRTGGNHLVRHLEILIQVCNGIHYAHQRGILHRDIKPANVMVGDLGEVYVLDWGLAVKIEERDELDMTVLAGTPGYAAPEMVMGDARLITEQTDVYLLGACLHEVLTKEHRHIGDDLVQTLIRAAKSRRYRYDPEVPTELAAVCNQACHRHAAERPASALEFRDALRGFLRHRGSMSVAEAAAKRLIALRRLVIEGTATKTDPGATKEERSRLIHRLFNECRFGFTEARRTWPENQAAAAGLEDCLLAMFEYELVERNPAAAEHLLAEIQHPPGDAQARVAALREWVAAQAQAQAELEGMRTELRFHGSNWARSSTAVVNGLFWGSVLFAIAWAIRSGRIRVTWAHHFFYALSWLVAALGLSLIFRRTVLANRAFRSFVVGACFVPVVAIVSRVVAWQLGFGIYQIVLIDYLIMLTAIGIGAAVLAPATWPAAGVVAVGAIFAAAYPAYSIDIAAGLVLGLSLFLAWVIRPRPKAADA